MPKYRVTTDKGTFEVELDRDPSSEEELQSLVTQHLSGGQAAPKTHDQLVHEHNLNRAAEADTEQGQLAVTSRAIAELPRAVGMFGGPPGAALGEAAGEMIEQAGGARENLNPLAIGAQAAIPEAVRLAGKAARPLAKGLYSSALKMSTTIKPEKRARILETGLTEGRIPTTGSIKNSVARQKEIEKEIEATIASKANAPIDTQAVASRVDDVIPRFETVNPDADRAILEGSKKEFLDNYPSMTAAKAQDVKKKTYKVLGQKAYGEQKTAAKEGEKALARGLKEELEGLFPDLKNLNAQDGALFDLNRALSQAANRIGNRDVLGIGVPIKTAAFGPAGFFAGLLDTPRVKSMLAIAIDKARHLEKANRMITTGVTRTATLPSVYEEE